MTNYQAGHDAEERAARYLERNGFNIIELNWRTRWCEIDIVAEKDRIVYFVEVKSRRGGAYGTGLEYITPKKLRQMGFAAEFWVSQHQYNGDYQLAAIGVDGEEMTFIDAI